MENGGRGHAKMHWQCHIGEPGHHGDQGEMVNRMRDDINELAAKSGGRHRRIARRVADFAARADQRVQRGGRQLQELRPRLLAHGQGKGRIALDLRIARAMIVIHEIAIQGSQQAGEVIEAMAEMPADAAVKRRWNPLGVTLRNHRAEQVRALIQNGDRGVQNTARILAGLLSREIHSQPGRAGRFQSGVHDGN